MGNKHSIQSNEQLLEFFELNKTITIIEFCKNIELPQNKLKKFISHAVNEWKIKNKQQFVNHQLGLQCFVLKKDSVTIRGLQISDKITKPQQLGEDFISMLEGVDIIVWFFSSAHHNNNNGDDDGDNVSRFELFSQMMRSYCNNKEKIICMIEEERGSFDETDLSNFLSSLSCHPSSIRYLSTSDTTHSFITNILK